MNKARRTIAVIASLCVLLFFPVVHVNAEEMQNSVAIQQAKDVDALINEIGALRAQAVMYTERQEAIEEQIRVLESQMSDLGIRILNEGQVAEKFYSDNQLRAAVPPSTSTVAWYSSGINYIVDGVTYRVERIYAQGKTAASSLCGVNYGVTLYNGENVQVTGGDPCMSMVSIYIQKAIGYIPVVGWLPYEVLFAGADAYTGVVSNLNAVSYSYTGTVCFCYVYPVNKGESHEEMTFVSTSFQLAGTVSNTGIKDGVPYSNSVNYSESAIMATDYASVDRAIQYYRANGFGSSYAYSFAFYSKYGEILHRVALPQPSAPIYVY